MQIWNWEGKMDPYKYINSLSLFGSEGGYKPGLDRIIELLKYLGSPHQNLNVIHIAGTNGKGSTAAILEKIYREAGYKTALYTSPHFFHFNERIKIKGRACSTYELSEIVEEVKKAADKLKGSSYGEASFFEIVTALAFVYFERHRADIVILETGLGGRLDATNVIKKPLLSIITNITLEHTELLGDTVAEIAAEKAGIIKKNSKVITDVQQDEALNVIKEKAESMNSKFIDLKKEYQIIKSTGNLKENLLTIKKYSRREENYQLSLLGSHQARNAALALRAVEELAGEFPVEKREIKKALKNVYWPGRMQKISENPLTIVDAAHNPAAFKELSKNIYDCRNEFKKIHFIFSILSDKDLSGILKELLKLKTKVKFYLAENSSFRTIKIDVLEEKVKAENFNYQIFNNLSEASRSAQNKAAEGDLIVAAGSFNTVFEAGIEIKSNKFRGGENE